jgi:hypothetical protein
VKYRVKGAEIVDTVYFGLKEVGGDINLFAEVNGVSDSILVIRNGKIKLLPLWEEEVAKALGVECDGPLPLEGVKSCGF